MTTKKHIDLPRLLKRLGSCGDEIDFIRGRTARQAWMKCERADWLLWAAEELGVDRRKLVLAACDCAETAMKYVPKGESRPQKAIDTARTWCRGGATLNAVRVAASDAYAAANACAAANANAAYDAAYAAAYAANAAAYDAAYDAANAANAAYAINADAAAADAAVAKHQKQMAALVRKRISWPMIERLALKKLNGGSK